jgi:hypothetical protein
MPALVADHTAKSSANNVWKDDFVCLWKLVEFLNTYQIFKKDSDS